MRWVSVTHPDDKDIATVQNLFPFHPLVSESVASPTLHPFVEDFDNHLFLILHFPVIYRTREPNKVAEVDFLITKDTLVTITYGPFERLDAIFQSFTESRGQDAHRTHTGFLLYHIIDRLFQEHVRDLDFLEHEITKMEERIFQGRGALTVEDIAHVRRDILDFRRPLRSQMTVLATFREKAGRFFGVQMAPYLLDLSVTEDRIISLVENQKETMDVLYQTHESLMSSHISQIIRTLTVFSAIILPLSLVASVWGMNHKDLPLRDGPNDFWAVMGIMGALAVALAWYFHRKKWI